VAKSNFYIDSTGADKASATVALRWLLGGPKARVFLAGDQNSILQGVLENVLEGRVIRSLINKGSVPIQGHELVLVTHHRMIYDGDDSRLLAFLPTKEFLDELDAVHNVSDMLVVPSRPEEVSGWIAARQAVTLGSTPQPHVPLHLSNRVAEAAVRSLSDSVNRSTGLSNARDRNRAIETFKILRDNNESYDPNEIKGFLISECSWEAPRADEVREIALQILRDRKLRSETAWIPNILEIWRNEARDSNQ